MKGKIALVVLLIAGISAYVYFTQTKEISVETIAAERGVILSTIDEPGYVQPAEETIVSAPIPGRIQRVNVSLGQTVRRGSVLFVLENTDLDAQLAALDQNTFEIQSAVDVALIDIASAAANLENAKREQERNRTLFESGAISREILDASGDKVESLEKILLSKEKAVEGYQSQMTGIENQREIVSAKIKQLYVTSPISGKVLSLPVKNNQPVLQGHGLVKIGSHDNLNVRVDLLSADMSDVAVGQTAIIDSPVLKGTPIPGQVKEIYPTAEETVSSLGVVQRRVPVIISYDPEDKLQPGYEVSVSIQTASSENILLPPEAIRIGKNNDYLVGVVEDQTVKYKKVTLGIRNRKQVEITAGLAPGELVLPDSSLEIPEGAKVSNGEGE